jgi:uncharacterized phiE125 gp8 family phage protein
MFNRLRQVSGPNGSPVNLADVKHRIRVDINTTAEDNDIQRMIDDAVARIDGPHGTGIVLMEQQWELRLDAFMPVIEIPLYPVLSIDSIKYDDRDGNEQTLSQSDYEADIHSNPARIIPAQDWPETKDGMAVVRVTFTAGHSTADNIPADLKQAIYLTVGHDYAHRESVLTTRSYIVPEAVQAILDRYKIWTVG